jgi:hypothetical protein
LRYRLLEDGVVIYALGESGTDRDGILDRKKPYAADVNLGFRLWDVAKRRQNPPVPKSP